MDKQQDLGHCLRSAAKTFKRLILALPCALPNSASSVESRGKSAFNKDRAKRFPQVCGKGVDDPYTCVQDPTYHVHMASTTHAMLGPVPAKCIFLPDVKDKEAFHAAFC